MIPAVDRKFVKRHDDLAFQVQDIHLLDRDTLLPEVWRALSNWLHKIALAFVETARRGRS